MPPNFSAQPPMRPLSVGNVVSAGLRLYRSHLKTYLQLALYASLWTLVPVYGWAKATTIAGLISRLGFVELIDQPESVATARSRISSRLWDFFVTALLVSLIFYGALLGFYIVLFVVGFVGAGLVLGLGLQNPLVFVFFILLGIIALIAFIAGVTWIYARLIIAEVPLAVEDNMNSTTTISRSWELTKGFSRRIQGVILVTFLISLPLFLISQVGSFAWQVLISAIFPEESAGFIVLSFIGTYALLLISNIFVMPLWQAIKAVIYYDLKSRREGLDLQLRDRRS